MTGTEWVIVPDVAFTMICAIVGLEGGGVAEDRDDESQPDIVKVRPRTAATSIELRTKKLRRRKPPNTSSVNGLIKARAAPE